MKTKTLLIYFLFLLIPMSFTSCDKDESDTLEESIWTEVNQDGYKYLGLTPAGEFMAVKMNSQNTLPREVLYINGDDPAVRIWFDEQGLPQMLVMDESIMLFENIRPNHIDVGLIVDGKVEITRDIEHDHGFLDFNTKTPLGNILTNIGLAVDGVLCAGGVYVSVKTLGALTPLAKLSCGGFLVSGAIKGVVKIVDNQEFSDFINIYGIADTLGSGSVSPGGLVSFFGSVVDVTNRVITEAGNLIDLVKGVLVGSGGSVQVTLTWDSVCDLDLWVTDPYGETIYWNNPSSASGGQLDYDNTYGYGPENIFWPPNAAPNGTYEVRVNYYSGTGTAQYSVLVIINDEVINNWQPFTGNINPNETIHVLDFTLGSKKDVVVFGETEDNMNKVHLKK